MWAILVSVAVASAPLIPYATQALGKTPASISGTNPDTDSGMGALTLPSEELDRVLVWMDKNASDAKTSLKLSLTAAKKIESVGEGRQKTGDKTKVDQSKSVTYTVTIANNGAIALENAEVLLIAECEWNWESKGYQDVKGSKPRVFSFGKSIPSLKPKQRLQFGFGPVVLNKVTKSYQTKYTNSNNTYGTTNDMEMRLKRVYVVIVDSAKRTLLIQPVT